MVFSNDIEINLIKIKMLLNSEKQNCSICLESIDKENVKDCIKNPKYPCRDFEYTSCCVCKEIMGSVIWF